MFFRRKKKTKERVFIRELRPEMTQCRIIQVDKKRKTNHESAN
jgi:hypothetical protein